MRTRTRPDVDLLEPELLEPLPVYVDGVEIAPQPVAPAKHVGSVAAVREAVADVTTTHTISPWSAPPAIPSVPQRTGRFLPSFSRMIVVQSSQLESLHEWWAANAENGRVVVGRRLALAEPHHDDGRAWRTRAELNSPGRVRAIPVELWMWPHLGAWTRLNLEPQRRLIPGPLYFACGHRVLDHLADTLIREL